jgi:hypothetical protein
VTIWVTIARVRAGLPWTTTDCSQSSAMVPHLVLARLTLPGGQRVASALPRLRCMIHRSTSALSQTAHWTSWSQGVPAGQPRARVSGSAGREIAGPGRSK